MSLYTVVIVGDDVGIDSADITSVRPRINSKVVAHYGVELDYRIDVPVNNNPVVSVVPDNVVLDGGCRSTTGGIVQNINPALILHKVIVGDFRNTVILQKDAVSVLSEHRLRDGEAIPCAIYTIVDSQIK